MVVSLVSCVQVITDDWLVNLVYAVVRLAKPMGLSIENFIYFRIIYVSNICATDSQHVRLECCLV